jgi:hypothetical protein
MSDANRRHPLQKALEIKNTFLAHLDVADNLARSLTHNGADAEDTVQAKFGYIRPAHGVEQRNLDRRIPELHRPADGARSGMISSR